MGSPPLTILVLSDRSNPSLAIDTATSLTSGPTPLKVRLVDRGEDSLFDPLRVDTSNGSEFLPSVSEQSPEYIRLLIEQDTPFVGVIRPEDRISAKGLSARVAALHNHPEVVVALGSADSQPSSAVPTPQRPLGSDELESGVIDGRDFSLQLIANRGEMARTPSALLFRRSAICTKDRSNGASEEDWHLWLTLRLLSRGPAWFDPIPTVETPKQTDSDSLRRWAQWPELVSDERYAQPPFPEGVSEAALVQHTYWGADILRRQLRKGTSQSAAQFAAGLNRLSAQWQSIDRERDQRTAPLPLHVVVLCSEDPDSASATAEASLRLADSVTLCGTSNVRRPDRTPSEVQWAATHPTVEAQLGSLIETSSLPLLVLHSDEEPELLDREQFLGLLERLAVEQGEGQVKRVFEIDTPSGPEIRLHRPDSPTSEEGDAETVHVHSVRIVSRHRLSRDEWLPNSNIDISHEELQTFVIAAPDYTEVHAGVVALHRLCDRLNAVGCNAYIEPLGEAVGLTHPDWDTPLWPFPTFDDAVVVYPEIVSGNPLQAPRVVRWLLNRPAWFTGAPMDEQMHDLIVTFDPQIAPEYPRITMPLFDPTRFFPKDVPGAGSLLWIGKGEVPEDFDRSGMTLVTTTWPPTQSELAARLRSADVLYTCDWLTSLVGEALMCATPVVLVGDQAWDRNEISLWPGMAWADDCDLASIRTAAEQFFPAYFEGFRGIDQTIEGFVELVNWHFGQAVAKK